MRLYIQMSSLHLKGHFEISMKSHTRNGKDVKAKRKNPTKGMRLPIQVTLQLEKTVAY